jgi:hypothetical protein
MENEKLNIMKIFADADKEKPEWTEQEIKAHIMRGETARMSRTDDQKPSLLRKESELKPCSKCGQSQKFDAER